MKPIKFESEIKHVGRSSLMILLPKKVIERRGLKIGDVLSVQVSLDETNPDNYSRE